MTTDDSGPFPEHSDRPTPGLTRERVTDLRPLALPMVDVDGTGRGRRREERRPLLRSVGLDVYVGEGEGRV